MSNFTVRKPTKKDLSASQIVYSKAWREALEGGAIVRAKLNDYLTKQGVWDSEKEKKFHDFQAKIAEKVNILNRGGIKISKAKQTAIEIKKLRQDFTDLISERTNYDAMTAEGCADNARFDYLVTVCVLDPNTNLPLFDSLDDYNAKASEDWAIEAASQLANLVYGLDPKYEQNLPENAFLMKYKFTDDKGRLINKDGHLIDIDKDGKERLIDEDGFFIAYNENGESYRVDRDGKSIETVVFEPFLDDEDQPIVEESQ